MSSMGFWHFAKTTPNRIALVADDHTSQTYGELGARVNQLSNALRKLGLKRGDAVAVDMANEPAWIEIFLAVHQIGLYMTPINFHLTGPEIAYIIDNCEAKVFFSSQTFATPAANALKELNNPELLAFATGKDGVEGFQAYESLFEGASAEDPEDRTAGALMLYTSGTTGRPKGVRRPLPEGTPDEMGEGSTLLAQIFDIKPQEGAHLVQGPFYHSAPAIFSTSTLHMGRTLIIQDRWNPEGCIERISRYKVTSTHMVPTMFTRILSLPDEFKAQHDISSMTNMIHAAAPCPVETKKQMFEMFGPCIYEYYGATEGGGAYVKPEEWLAHPGTVGRPWPGADIKIYDDEGNELPPGKVGTIYMLSVMGDFEYYKDKGKTDESRRGAYITVGDVGYLDDEGWLFISDRKSDMIIAGGVNIYPAEIEGDMIQHPKVRDVAVFGIPSKDLGEAVHAVIELEDGVEPSDELKDDIMQFTMKSVAKYKLPKDIEFTDALPRQPSGKLFKRKLRDKFWEGRDNKLI